MSIGTKVKRFREAKGLSQDDLALRLDVAQSTISSIESDKNIPNSLLLSNIAKELDINMNELFDDERTINNVYDNNDKVAIGFGNNNTFTVGGLSEKLVELYEERIKELKEQVQELKEEIKVLKNK
ncbi:helix-turn-helix domain-containing protein [Chryseobacterium sp. HMWF035]|uniref:helix-turn-helix domain-containing protein n=1 Tax=Chryseobacterium sp. HMWF035 TaxID=2056868 RepID=UPI000D588034|nr:helix-turn-helix transcriptional regulator [Chryseobacterium sp. HMWF035]PVV57305.1 XRE family transcriptional regulator [Chryseobacterium sp. HMWF035]